MTQSGGGAIGLVRGQEVRKARGQASIGERSSLNTKYFSCIKKFISVLSPREIVRERVYLGSPETRKARRQADIGGCSPRKNKFLPLLGKVMMSFEQYPPLPSLTREGESNSTKRTYRPNVLTSYRLKKKAAFTLAEGAARIAMPNSQRHTAFTLAEVLITLGIIGVVAALTIPAMVGNYKKHVVETSLKKYNSILNQAIQMSEAVNGPAVNWEWSKTLDPEKVNAFFDKYFAPYISIVDKKHATDRNTIYYKIYSSDGDGPLWDFSNANNIEWRQLSDGGAVMLSMWGQDGIMLGSLSFILPTGSNPSYLIEGKDVFSFSIALSEDESSVSVSPRTYRNWNCTYLRNNLDTFIERCRSVNYTGEGIYPSHYCAALIYCNGWKIPDYYPVKF